LLLALVLGCIARAPLSRGGEKSDGSPTPGEDGRSVLASRLIKTVAELRRVREERYRLEKRHASEARSLKDRLAELEARKRSLKGRTTALEKRSGEEEEKAAVLHREAETIRSRLKKAGDALKNAAVSLRNVIRDSIPFRRKERLASIDAVLGRLATESLPDRLRSLNAVLEYEIVLGSTSEAYRSRVGLGENRMPRARCLRLGMVGLAFITEDGKTTGILVGGEKGKFGWKTDLGFRDRWGIKRALEILEKRRPPVFIRFPVDFGRMERSGSASPRAPARKGEDEK
jgi:hypothetical protein